MSEDCPLARSEGLIVEELDGELLVYDSETKMAHALAADAVAVWRGCDGHTDVHVLAVRCATSDEQVRMTLARLGALGLIEDTQADQDGDTRRSALRKIGIAGAGLVSASAISSILVPTAAAAGSCVQPGGCVSSDQMCCTGHTISTPDCLYGQLQCCIPAGACAMSERDLGPTALSCCNGTATPDRSCAFTGLRCT